MKNGRLRSTDLGQVSEDMARTKGWVYLNCWKEYNSSEIIAEFLTMNMLMKDKRGEMFSKGVQSKHILTFMFNLVDKYYTSQTGFLKKLVIEDTLGEKWNPELLLSHLQLITGELMEVMTKDHNHRNYQKQFGAVQYLYVIVTGILETKKTIKIISG